MLGASAPRPTAVRHLHEARRRALCTLPRLAHPARAASLRPLRRSRGVAGSSVRGMWRPASRVRERPGRARVRAAGSQVRGRLEGGWPEAALCLSRVTRRRGRAVASRRRPDVRSRRSRPPSRARSLAAGAARARARAPLGASGRAAAAAHASDQAPARARSARAAAQRRGSVRRVRACAPARLPRGRRLHNRFNGECLCVGAAARRCPESGGRRLGASGSLRLSGARRFFAGRSVGLQRRRPASPAGRPVTQCWLEREGGGSWGNHGFPPRRTANACASALRRAGARSVEVVAFARAVRLLGRFAPVSSVFRIHPNEGVGKPARSFTLPAPTGKESRCGYA
jgi:hypothetical protein